MQCDFSTSDRAIVRGSQGTQLSRGPGLRGAMGGPRSVPRGPRKSPKKKEAWERVVKAKVDAVCFLEKNQSKAVLRVVGCPGIP